LRELRGYPGIKKMEGGIFITTLKTYSESEDCNYGCEVFHVIYFTTQK